MEANGDADVGAAAEGAKNPAGRIDRRRNFHPENISCRRQTSTFLGATRTLSVRVVRADVRLISVTFGGSLKYYCFSIVTQEVQHIGSAYNRTAKSFADYRQGKPGGVNAQYNSPVNLYSKDAAVDTYQAQSTILTSGVQKWVSLSVFTNVFSLFTNVFCVILLSSDNRLYIIRDVDHLYIYKTPKPNIYHPGVQPYKLISTKFHKLSIVLTFQRFMPHFMLKLQDFCRFPTECFLSVQRQI